MKTVQKYPLARVETQEPLLPWHAEPLTAQVEGDQLYLYALIDTEIRLVKGGLVAIFATGAQAAQCMRYLSTVQLSGEALHVFVMGYPT